MSKLRFLLLENNTKDAELVLSELDNAGLIFDHVLVNTEATFVSALKNFKPHIVFSNYSIPTYTGINAINEVTKNHSGIPIIIVTNTINEETAVECMKSGASDYILKSRLFRLGSATRSILEMEKLKKENREAHKLLKDNEDRLRNIIDHSSNLFYMQNVDGILTYISPQTRLFFDCEPEYMLHKQISFFSDNPLNEIGKKITQKAIETGKTQPAFELELIGKNNRKIWVEVHEAPVLKNGRVTGIVGALIDITNWKTTYDKLILSEEKFRKLFSEAPDGILLTNDKGIIVDCNQAYCNMLESKKEEIINSHVSESICEKDKHFFIKKYPNLIKTGKAEAELCLLTKKNNIICTRRSVSALYNEAGEFTGAIVHTNDITGQKRIQDEIEAREARLSAIFKAADNVSFILSTVEGEDSEILEFSTGSENIFGYSRDEAIGKPVKILHTVDTIKNFSKYLNKMKKGEEGFKGQSTMVKKSGEKFTALHTAYPIFDNYGKLVHALGVTIDITNVIEIEKALKKREEQLTTLINASPDIICFKDGEGRWQLANNAELALFQLQDVDYIGKSNAEIASYTEFYKNTFLNCMETDENAWKKGSISIDEEIIPIPDGSSKTFDIIKVPLFHPNGDRKALIVIGRDISKHKHLETQLRHSHKMEAIGLMASGIAHNFNNILQAIVGYVDFAKEGLKETEQRFKDIDQINQHVRRATKLTRSLLAVGKDQFMEKSNVNLNDIIKPIVDLTARASKNIEIKYNPEKNIPSVYVDGNQIDQVIMNIFMNARDAMPDEGTITVETKSISIDEDFCSKNAWAKPGEYVLISISDTGHGMNQETKRRIFEPYFTTKEISMGIGLGLSTAFGIISQHKGMLNVISETNKGTTFEVFLPVNQDDKY